MVWQHTSKCRFTDRTPGQSPARPSNAARRPPSRHPTMAAKQSSTTPWRSPLRSTPQQQQGHQPLVSTGFVRYTPRARAREQFSQSALSAARVSSTPDFESYVHQSCSGGPCCPLALSSVGSAGVLLRLSGCGVNADLGQIHGLPPSSSSNALLTNAMARPAAMDSAGLSD